MTAETATAAPAGLRARFLRLEGPTWLLALAVYAGWSGLVWFHAAMPWWLLWPLAAYVTALHFSLQHEAIHGWRSAPGWLRTALVWPPIGLWLPFELYRASHSRHHRNADLTYPGRDTESVYHHAADWAAYPRWWRGLLLVNQTFFGRLLLGPPIRLFRLAQRDLAPLLRGETATAGIWLRHGLAVATILWFVTGPAGMPAWQYLLFFFHSGMVLGWLRPFLEHRWGALPYERVAAVESNWVFGLLFLWNNLHIVHHRHPTMPWYEIPGFYRAHREALLALNGGYVFPGYGALLARYWRRPAFTPVHPEA